MVRTILTLAFLFLVAGQVGAASFDGELAAGHFAVASALLSQIPAGSRGEAVEKILAVLPLMQWSPETEQAWENCTAAIETETNSYWGTRNLGGLLGALAAPTVPHTAAVDALLDRAVTASKQWAGQGAPLVVSKGLVWYGDFGRAFAPYPAQSTPEPLAEFAFETLADKPELGRQDALWTLALDRMDADLLAAQKAVHALAFAGRLPQALEIASRQANPIERTGYETLAARYARYGGHEDDFSRAMGVAAGDLHLLPSDASALPVLRDLLEETRQPPIPTLPEAFWKSVEMWAASLPREPSSAAVAEIAGASAWAGREEASTLLPTLAGTPWQDSARIRVACGWLWNGKSQEASQCAAAIKDPEWRALADSEMAYLARQLAGNELAK